MCLQGTHALCKIKGNSAENDVSGVLLNLTVLFYWLATALFDENSVDPNDDGRKMYFCDNTIAHVNGVRAHIKSP